MKIIRAEFENFRLLRDLRIDFSTDRTLTVIRAANETGKTTILNGLQWALYGDNALPEKGQGYRLHPIDWDESDVRQIPISVQVDFETMTLRRGSRGITEIRRQYRIIRSTFETVDGVKWSRTPSTVKLFSMGDTGSELIERSEEQIDEELPPELREVFFTDGDRALSFIEADVNVRTKRERVEKAIQSLLGLGVIENALGHVKKAASEINKEAKNVGANEELIEIATRLEQIDEDLADLEKKRNDAKSQFSAFDAKLVEIQNQINTALIKGDRELLKREIEQTESHIKQIKRQQETAGKEHSDLFRGMSLSRDLLVPVLEKSLGELDKLSVQGKIPNETIPILEERLKSTTCICGESLESDYTDGRRRRDNIQCLIDDSRKADELQRIITELYFGSQSLQPVQITDEEHWLAKYDRVFKDRDEQESRLEDQGKKLKALEAKLEDIQDTNIQGLRDTKRKYGEQRDRFHALRVRCETQLEVLQKEKSSLSTKRNNLLREQKKGDLILAQLEVTQDVKQVLDNSYNRITNEELVKVSELMNTIFLEMIGADPEQNAIIQQAEISKDFDILVYGPNNRTLNPDRDLNGASRRALTLAFILALTKVSGVEAPNVIDTPLGMMSGYVKRSVLRTAIRESSQLILFLTRSEIADCEEILDAEAGRVITLTNSAHYPRMLINDPHVEKRTVLRCECDHRMECLICQRQMDLEPEMEQMF